ncbi:MAG: hypothetical protein IKP64_13560 [Selenomonadaceae bacterium]|nr:hypothetical protein [Selenomonadaceae bacterium]MBR4384570.1 hypothetical protein [Selenomonadaceae bacterium]
MDVSNVSSVSQGIAQYAAQTKGTAQAKAADQTSTAQNQTSSTSANIGEAYDVDISDEAKQAQQAASALTQPEVKDDNGELVGEAKGLSKDQVRYLEESIAVNEQAMLNLMMQALTDSNDKLQGWLDEGAGILNFDGTQIDAARFGMPEVATNPEDAAKAVAEGGDWSVDAVSSRIFDLATAIAGDDPEKLSAMRAAVEEGFKQAGAVWTNATGLQDMPEITQNTYDEIMSRFDKRASELNPTSVVQ